MKYQLIFEYQNESSCFTERKFPKWRSYCIPAKQNRCGKTEDPAVLRVVYLDQATALNGKKEGSLYW